MIECFVECLQGGDFSTHVRVRCIESLSTPYPVLPELGNPPGPAVAGQCVEVAVTPEAIGVRDSKNRAAGHLTVTGAQWSTFLRGIRTGRFER
ncbi:DUF397 domain-containing protein [Saccharopolyspora thermophila]|uniref:DUF397 domain-containing protein n=1 Tax=Saccharopolyspora thermophila TaxID=89367 RepID=UPI0027E4124D|nr:DUF397 domain-containing protein [Saccharopolyspora subtropica]